MKQDSLAQVYSSKSNDELLALAADEGSLREEAIPILADELQRRNLNGHSAATTRFPEASALTTFNRALSRAKWLGLWLVTTLIATFGTAINIGIITTSLRPFVDRAGRIHFTQSFVYGPHYPLPILIALLIGMFSYLRFLGSYRYWVWVLPAVWVLSAIVDWKQSNQASFADSVMHFFGTMPYPANRDQLDSTMFLYMSLAYVVGVLIQDSFKEYWTAAIRFAQRVLT